MTHLQCCRQRVRKRMDLYWYDRLVGHQPFVVYLCVCVSAGMSPYCSAHDEWLIMKLCMYVGYHTANNVSNFGGDPVTQLNLIKRVIVLFTLFLRTWRSIAVTRSQFLRRLLRDHAQTAALGETGVDWDTFNFFSNMSPKIFTIEISN